MLQAVASMHTQGWGHCDFKPQQVRVSLSESGKSFHRYKLVDAGSCTSFTGKHPCLASHHVYAYPVSMLALHLLHTCNQHSQCQPQVMYGTLSALSSACLAVLGRSIV